MRKRHTIEQQAQDAVKYVKDHQILRHKEWMPGHGIVTIGKPGTSIGKVDFVLTPMGYLTMTGDHDMVCWGGFYEPEERSTVAHAIAWMGSRKSPDSHYFRAKMYLGMTGDEYSEVWDCDAAFDDLVDLARDDKDAVSVEVWRELFELVRSDASQHEVMDLIFRHFDDAFEFAGNIGMRPSLRRIMAWALVSKAYALLREGGAYGVNHG